MELKQTFGIDFVLTHDAFLRIRPKLDVSAHKSPTTPRIRLRKSASKEARSAHIITAIFRTSTPIPIQTYTHGFR